MFFKDKLIFKVFYSFSIKVAHPEIPKIEWTTLKIPQKVKVRSRKRMHSFLHIMDARLVENACIMHMYIIVVLKVQMHTSTV